MTSSFLFLTKCDLNVFCTSVELGVFGVVYSGHAITVQCDRIICMWNYLQAYQQAPEPYSLLYRCSRSNVLSLHRRQCDHLLLLASPGDCSPFSTKTKADVDLRSSRSLAQSASVYP